MLNEIPDALRKKLPKRLPIGAALIGRLGRHVDFKGHGLGEALLFDATKRIANSPVASHALIVDPIDDKAVEFYRSFNFIRMDIEGSSRMYLTVDTALKAVIKD